MSTSDLNYKINKFIDHFTHGLLGCIGFALLGIAFKMLGLPGGGFIFISSMLLLVLLLLAQIGLSFLYAFAELKLALLGAFCSLGLVLGLLAIIFRYQEWLGWQVALFISLPVYLISSFFLGFFLLKRYKLHTTHRKFLMRNLLIPFIFSLVLFIVSFALRPETFFDTFNARKARQQHLNEIEGIEL